MMKNVGKKFAALSMATLLAFGVLGCGSDKKDDAKVPAAVQTQKIDTPEGKSKKASSMQSITHKIPKRILALSRASTLIPWEINIT